MRRLILIPPCTLTLGISVDTFSHLSNYSLVGFRELIGIRRRLFKQNNESTARYDADGTSRDRRTSFSRSLGILNVCRKEWRPLGDDFRTFARFQFPDLELWIGPQGGSEGSGKRVCFAVIGM